MQYEYSAIQYPLIQESVFAKNKQKSLSKRRLLILSCSQAKRSHNEPLPAIERYDSPSFRLLRRFLRQQPDISQEEQNKLKECQCPACQKYGLKGLKASGGDGFYNRATHNLWVLLEEARQIEEHLNVIGDYETWYLEHLDNTTYRPLIHKLLQEISQTSLN